MEKRLFKPERMSEEMSKNPIAGEGRTNRLGNILSIVVNQFDGNLQNYYDAIHPRVCAGSPKDRIDFLLGSFLKCKIR